MPIKSEAYLFQNPLLVYDVSIHGNRVFGHQRVVPTKCNNVEIVVLEK
jgi:hypothetical protein